jgi:sugar fermentation stimulation protein A
MNFDNLVKATAVRRYKRFLTDCTLDDGTEITVHCPNSGRMTGCIEEGAEVRLSVSDNPKRKYSHTLELVKMPDSWVCVNTGNANKVGAEFVEKGLIPELKEVVSVKCEVTYPFSKSRVDLELTKESGERCFVEIKSCTLVEEGMAMFPDAPTVRGQKHLKELMELPKYGIKPVVLFLIMRNDAKTFKAANHIDPKFAELLTEVAKNGVEVLAYHVVTSPDGLTLAEKIPVML